MGKTKDCPYCKRSVRHGGKCYEENSSKACLIFERDPRGKQLFLDNVRFNVDFGTDIPEIRKPISEWTLHGIEKTVTINKILKIEWNTNAKGLHGIYVWADVMYWSDENGVVPEKANKPKLVLCR